MGTPSKVIDVHRLTQSPSRLSHLQPNLRSISGIAAVSCAVPHRFGGNSAGDPKAATLSFVASATARQTAAQADPAAEMTKYGMEQEAACRAVRLAAKLCQVGVHPCVLDLHGVKGPRSQPEYF